MKQLSVPVGVVCVPIRNGQFSVLITGYGDKSVIGPIDYLPVSGTVYSPLSDPFTLNTPDYSVVLNIPKNTVVDMPTDEDEVTIDIVTGPPDPGDITFGGQVYDFGPDGTTFDPFATITLPYDPDVVSEPYSLEIFYYDGTDWVALPGPYEVDTMHHSISVNVTHFTNYASAYIKPPSKMIIQDSGGDFGPGSR